MSKMISSDDEKCNRALAARVTDWCGLDVDHAGQCRPAPWRFDVPKVPAHVTAVEDGMGWTWVRDEIKERIDGIENSEAIPAAPLDALRAVVKLHGWSHARGSTYLQCDGCPSTSDATMTAWPCPTITAIADALGVETGETPK